MRIVSMNSPDASTCTLPLDARQRKRWSKQCKDGREWIEVVYYRISICTNTISFDQDSKCYSPEGYVTGDPWAVLSPLAVSILPVWIPVFSSSRVGGGTGGRWSSEIRCWQGENCSARSIDR